MHCHPRNFEKWARWFKEAGALDHNEGDCPLGEECCSKGKEKLIKALFYGSDGTLTEATTEQIEGAIKIKEAHAERKKMERERERRERMRELGFPGQEDSDSDDAHARGARILKRRQRATGNGNKRQWKGVACDECDMNPIVGEHLYNCDECEDYDLCQNCQAKGVHSDHTMSKIDV